MDSWDSEFYDSKSDVQFKLGLKTIDLLNVRDGEKILDIGCGTGRLTLELAKRAPNGLIIGIDSNLNMITKANENLKRSGLNNVEFIQENLLQYNPTIQFDAIFSNSALHWIQQTRQLYQKIFALLSPGGRLAAQMATKGSLNQFVPYFLAPLQPLNLSHHFRNWTYPAKLISPKTLHRILTSIGFQNIEIWVEDQKLKFKTPEDLLDFLKTASLVPILSQIPPEKRESYLNYLLNEFKVKKEGNLCATMKRLFLKLKK
ncbi:MAG: class I SAM-dependent methyltransferase [Candidatus Helarchaeota archaeon]